LRALFGVLKFILGLAAMIAAFAVEIAWLGVCFGTVIIGTVLLLTYPTLLFSPFRVLSDRGLDLIASGLIDIKAAEEEG